MNEKDKQTVKSIIFYCNRIEEHINYFGDLKENYLNNNLLQDACSLSIIQIGEQVNRLSEEFKFEHSDMPWGDIIGMRNVHTHNYESVNDEIVLETLEKDIPKLKDYLEKILKKIPDSS